jgi:hypothetical protein
MGNVPTDRSREGQPGRGWDTVQSHREDICARVFGRAVAQTDSPDSS